MGKSWSSNYDCDAPIALSHFKLSRFIGRGAFGKVKVVIKRDTTKPYALKYINKEQCVRKRAYINIFRERTLLEKLEHAFIVNLRFAFQDDENMVSVITFAVFNASTTILIKSIVKFMVIDLMLGGDLRFHLNRMGKFTERMCVFYAAQMASAIQYLHAHGVIHRDIKPDNILLDQSGHAHITDFNCATVMKEGKIITSQTGTHGYMAPEVYGNRGYTTAVDWWSLGVVLWECLHGRQPFTASRQDKLIYRVRHAFIEYSEDLSHGMRSFLEGLLQRNVSRRFGTTTTNPHLHVMQHSLFKRIDWDKLQAKTVKPPFIPDAHKLNFDARYELEEVLLEENSLHIKPRNCNKDSTDLSREMKLIETNFLPFDFTSLERESNPNPSLHKIGRKVSDAKHIIKENRQSLGSHENQSRCVDPIRLLGETNEDYEMRKKLYWTSKQNSKQPQRKQGEGRVRSLLTTVQSTHEIKQLRKSKSGDQTDTFFTQGLNDINQFDDHSVTQINFSKSTSFKTEKSLASCNNTTAHKKDRISQATKFLSQTEVINCRRASTTSIISISGVSDGHRHPPHRDNTTIRLNNSEDYACALTGTGMNLPIHVAMPISAIAQQSQSPSLGEQPLLSDINTPLSNLHFEANLVNASSITSASKPDAVIIQPLLSSINTILPQEQVEAKVDNQFDVHSFYPSTSPALPLKTTNRISMPPSPQELLCQNCYMSETCHPHRYT